MTIADLRAFGVLELLDVELAQSLGAMAGTVDTDVELAIALTSRNVRRGHVCLPLDTTSSDLDSTMREAGVELPEAGSWANALYQSKLVDGGPLVLDEKRRLYLRRYFELERDIALELAKRAAKSSDEEQPWLAETLDRLFGDDPKSPRRRAGRNAMNHRVSVLCGGPGTGKTTTVAAIVALLIEGRLREGGPAPKVVLLAPTGKAAVRLGEAVTRAKKTIRASDEVLASIPDQAITVHRALGMRRRGMRFGRHADSPIDADILVLDEASMIDLGLMRQLLVAAPLDATIVIVGDPDQLTSVEAGSVLRDLVRANEETWWRGRVAYLTETYRYDPGKPLGRLVAAIRGGNVGVIEELLASQGTEGAVQWSSFAELGPELDRAATRWCKIVGTTAAEQHFQRRSQYVVLSPYRKGPIGTRGLGLDIERRVSKGDIPAHPIIIEENDRELGVYNGDFGMLLERDGGQVATIQCEPHRFSTFAEASLPRYSSAYALSVHKAQGSEFDEVLIVMPEEDGPLLTRELLYTAVSRARGQVRLIGPLEVIAAAVGRSAQRFSGLVDRIAALAP